jgi:hypothetical protein
MTHARPQTPLLAAALAACLLAFAHSPAQSQQTPALIRGGGSAGVEKEATFKFSTIGGRPASADYDRNLLKVPAHYGEVIAVTQAGKRPILWYRGQDGSVRNVILGDARTLVRITSE